MYFAVSSCRHIVSGTPVHFMFTFEKNSFVQLKPGGGGWEGAGGVFCLKDERTDQERFSALTISKFFWHHRLTIAANLHIG